MLKAGVFIISSLLALPGSGAEVRKAQVTVKDERYIVSMDILVDAASQSVGPLVTDYENLERLSSSITDSKLIGQDGASVIRRMQLKSCVMLFCFGKALVERVQPLTDGGVRTEIIPGQSDFQSGHFELRIEPSDDGRATFLLYRAELTPAFWVPPIIGPWMMKNQMKKMGLETGQRIEQILADPNVH